MIASAALTTFARSTGRPSTLILPGGRRLAAGALGPPEAFVRAEGEADDALELLSEVGGGCPRFEVFVDRWPCRSERPPKYGFALNMVSTIPATMASTRHPAISGTIIPL